jgi:hypothetical protein
MKIMQRVTIVRPIEVESFDHYLTLPMSGRKRLGMKTICHHCGESIQDETFIGAFKAGMKNMIFHVACWERGQRKGE